MDITNVHGINLYGVLMMIMDNLQAGGHSDSGTLSPSTPVLRKLLEYPLKLPWRNNTD